MLLCGQLEAINSTATSEIQKGMNKKAFLLIPEKETTSKNFVFL
jgi:hypothetical protein